MDTPKRLLLRLWWVYGGIVSVYILMAQLMSLLWPLAVLLNAG